MIERYEIWLNLGEINIQWHAAEFWRDYPEYREAPFWAHGSDLPRNNFVTAAFPDKEEEAPEPIHVRGSGDDRRLCRDFEKSRSLLRGKIHRVVFHSTDWGRVREFRDHVLMLQKVMREVRFSNLYPGDGSADDQWGVVFGGDLR